MNEVKDVIGLLKDGFYSHSSIFNNLRHVSVKTRQAIERKTAFKIQLESAINKISIILRANCTTFENLLKVAVYLSCSSFFNERSGFLLKHFQGSTQGRTAVVAGLAVPFTSIQTDMTTFQYGMIP
jgi:enamine deaminase RidA (YjgF/YER057c/UK114 family)